MKNLAKVLMSLVAVMLISSSVFATGELDGDTGSVTVSVTEHLAFTTPNLDIEFVYDEFTPMSSVLLVEQTFTAETNVDWDLDIVATDVVATPGIVKLDGTALDNGTYNYDNLHTVKTITLSWTLVIDGNVKAGDYTLANLAYTLAKH